MISAYERVAELGDANLKKSTLIAINDLLKSDTISGRAANKISIAEGYRAQIETTLGQDFRRFQSLLPTYREQQSLLSASKSL